MATNSTQTNAEYITQLLRLLKDFEDFFDGALGDWDTKTAELELNTYSKPFNSKYYPVPIINKETFHKELECLVKIGVFNMVKQYQYGNTIFNTPNK